MHRVVLAACFAVVVGQAHAAPVGAIAEIDRPLVIVGQDEVIWLSEVEARTKDAAERDKLIDTMIDERLMVREGRRAKIEVEDSEVNAALDEIKKQNNLDDAALDKILQDQGYTREGYMRDLAQQILIIRTTNQLVSPQVMVTDADIAAEAKKRKLKLPIKDSEKDTIRTELRKQAMVEQTAKWLAGLRKRTAIERRP